MSCQVLQCVQPTNMGLFFSLIKRRMSRVYQQTTYWWLVGSCAYLCLFYLYHMWMWKPSPHSSEHRLWRFQVLWPDWGGFRYYGLTGEISGTMAWLGRFQVLWPDWGDFRYYGLTGEVSGTMAWLGRFRVLWPDWEVSGTMARLGRFQVLWPEPHRSAQLLLSAGTSWLFTINQAWSHLPEKFTV
jgi:hypothetical protein